MCERTTVEIFWTGGYDSTFRVCQLSRKNVVISPYYLMGDRPSEQMEIQAIERIREKLIKHSQTIATINPLQCIPKKDRQSDIKVSKAFQSLTKHDYMGSQYNWLGSFALNHPGIELSIHKDDKAILLIQKYGALSVEKNQYGLCYVIDREKSPDELITVFGNERFPLANYTKLQMKQEYIQMGLSDIINDTWFCFTPINGKPCGICNPCRYTIEEGMSERLPKDALRRYKRQKSLPFKAYQLIKRATNKMRYIIQRNKFDEN